jgi:hypothetical protein
MATVSPAGAVMMKGDGIKSVQARMQQSFEAARKLGPTMKSIRDEATAYLTKLERGHVAEGYEVVEPENPASKPPIVLSEQAQVKRLLAKLESTPMLRKRPTNVWTIEDITAETPEKIYRDALVSLGHAGPLTDAMKRNIGPSFAEKEPTRKRWWSRK